MLIIQSIDLVSAAGLIAKSTTIEFLEKRAISASVIITIPNVSTKISRSY